MLLLEVRQLRRDDVNVGVVRSAWLRASEVEHLPAYVSELVAERREPSEVTRLTVLAGKLVAERFEDLVCRTTEHPEQIAEGDALARAAHLVELGLVRGDFGG